MIKNLASVGMAGVLALLAGCGDASAKEPEPFQGVVEHEERILGFEVGGRVATIDVERGDAVEPDTRLAALDDTLERLTRDAREAEVRAAEARLALVEEGPRAEEIRAARAELSAAEANEQLLGRTLARQRNLVSSGAGVPAQVDELETQLARATAQKQALGQRLRALREGSRSQERTVAEAQVAAARSALEALDERLRRYALEAGLRGTVLDVHVEPGEIVAPGAPVVTVADVSHPYVDVFVPQGDLAGVEVGVPARARVDAFDRPFDGTIEHVSSRTEFTPRFLFSERERPNLVIRVRVRLNDPEGELPAGVPAFVTFLSGQGR